jgi:hypothetical protein
MQERMNLMVNVDLFGAPDIEKRPRYFKPLDKQLATIMDKQLDMETLLQDETSQQKIADFLVRHNGKLHQYAFFPITGNNKKTLLWAFRKSDQQPMAIVDIDVRPLLHKQQIKQAALKSSLASRALLPSHDKHNSFDQ